MGIIRTIFVFLMAFIMGRAAAAVEILALRQQVAVFKQSVKCPKALDRILTDYFDYYHNSRPHLSLDRNSPMPREVDPPSQGEVISIRQVGGLHHRYSRAA